MSVFPSSCLLMPSIPSQLAVCFGNFFCGLLKSALRTSRAARVDYQSVIHHFDGLLQPHSDPSPLLLFTCLAHSPVKKSHASSRIASCNWIFYPDCRSLGKKQRLRLATAQQQRNLHVAWNSSGTNMQQHVWSVQRVDHGACGMRGPKAAQCNQLNGAA